jgi:hypothetical protein
VEKTNERFAVKETGTGFAYAKLSQILFGSLLADSSLAALLRLRSRCSLRSG